MTRYAVLLSTAWLMVFWAGCAATPLTSTNPIRRPKRVLNSGSRVSRESLALQPFDVPTVNSTSNQRSYFSGSDSEGLTFRMQSDDLASSQIYFDSEFYAGDVEKFEGESDLDSQTLMGSFFGDLGNDHRNFYSMENVPVAAALLGVGGWMANSDLDQNILEHVQDNITFNNKSNEYQEFVGEFRFFGEGYFLIPVYIGTSLLGEHVFADHPNAALVGDWGDRSVRAILVGAPVLVVSQFVIGGSRPGESFETREGSEWQFLEDNNGVSGHAFMGAIPFLTAFQMADDPKVKVLCFAASTLPALSRITENGHYPSQALLGWGLAYLATSSVNRTENDSFQVAPFLSDTGIGIGVTMRH